ncbi:GTPase Era [Hugenholtzia roseola]|uniref:GTPase Era n=1 Tax=Hugenholtzia roseola TaxID=1002 RepID=UPI000A32A074|nr:GTPase Era [Hugenholtzia roseola]
MSQKQKKTPLEPTESNSELPQFSQAESQDVEETAQEQDDASDEDTDDTPEDIFPLSAADYPDLEIDWAGEASFDANHKAGFVSIIGKPNSGKSTLMNALVGEKLAIVTPKAQTTRHRIMGIWNGEDYQIIYSDTPGIIAPKYELHQKMMLFVEKALEDADLVLFVTDIHEKHDQTHAIEILQTAQRKHKDLPILVLINKIDLATESEVEQAFDFWQQTLSPAAVIPTSALHLFNLEQVKAQILAHLPLHPPYFAKDQLTDRPEKFFAAEIFREKIFLHYEQEIPYCCEVKIMNFEEEEKMYRIAADIHVERLSQKGIVIGKNGAALKKVSTEARKEMEVFFGKKVFLESYVRVSEDWRKKAGKLSRFGY